MGSKVPDIATFVQPTLLLDVTPDNPVFHEEIFGPVPMIFRVADEEEAIALGNDTDYGLAGAVWTADTARAAEAAAVVFDAAAVTAAGELEDVLLGLSRHTGEEPDPDRILAMQRLKTAHYTVGAPLRAGALLAGADPDLARAMGEAGADLGAAYQVIDDVLGVFGDPGETGKSADGDLREGKATVLTAHGRRDPAVRALLDAGPATPADIEAARREWDPYMDIEGAAHRWVVEVFDPVVRSVPLELRAKLEPAEVMHQLLEHRWYLSEARGQAVPLQEVVDSYVDTVLRARRDEDAVALHPTTTMLRAVPPADAAGQRRAGHAERSGLSP